MAIPNTFIDYLGVENIVHLMKPLQKYISSLNKTLTHLDPSSSSLLPDFASGLLQLNLLLIVLLSPLLRRQRPHELTNNSQHDFVGSSSDGPQPQVSIQPRDIVFARESHAAPKLEARIGDLPLRQNRM